MLPYELANVALETASDFDSLRLNKTPLYNAFPKFAKIIRELVPEGTVTALGKACPRDILIIKDVLEHILPAHRQIVKIVIDDLHNWLRITEEAWEARRYDAKYVDAFLAWSKIAAARVGRSGHTFAKDGRYQ